MPRREREHQTSPLTFFPSLLPCRELSSPSETCPPLSLFFKTLCSEACQIWSDQGKPETALAAKPYVFPRRSKPQQSRARAKDRHLLVAPSSLLLAPLYDDLRVGFSSSLLDASETTGRPCDASFVPSRHALVLRPSLAGLFIATPSFLSLFNDEAPHAPSSASRCAPFIPFSRRSGIESKDVRRGSKHTMNEPRRCCCSIYRAGSTHRSRRARCSLRWNPCPAQNHFGAASHWVQARAIFVRRLSGLVWSGPFCFPFCWPNKPAGGLEEEEGSGASARARQLGRRSVGRGQRREGGRVEGRGVKVVKS